MSDSFMSINGSRAMSGRLTVPKFGAWTADFVLADSAAITDSVQVVIGDLDLTGHTQRAASFAGSRSALMVGGHGGWQKVLPARGYSHEAGVMLSAVLGDAARESGESIVVDNDRAIGPSYARRGDVAERVLRRLLGGRWWIDNAGVTRTSDRDASPISSPFTAETWSGSKGRFAVATEHYSDWLPGRTFTSPTVTIPQTISSVSFTADNDGKVRLDVLTDTTGEDRLHDRIRAIIRDEVEDLRFAPTFEYIVAATTGMPGRTTTVDATPTDPSMPALLRVPLAPELGLVVPPVTGTRCRIRFANGDPTRGEVASLGSTTEHVMTTEATVLLIYNVLVALMTAAGGGPLLAVVLQPLIVPAILAAMSAQGAPAPPGLVAQVALQTTLTGAMAAGTTPSNGTGPLAAGIAALSAKLPNVSGFFPSVGVPLGA